MVRNDFEIEVLVSETNALIRQIEDFLTLDKKFESDANRILRLYFNIHNGKTSMLIHQILFFDLYSEAVKRLYVAVSVLDQRETDGLTYLFPIGERRLISIMDSLVYFKQHYMEKE